MPLFGKNKDKDKNNENAEREEQLPAEEKKSEVNSASEDAGRGGKHIVPDFTVNPPEPSANEKPEYKTPEGFDFNRYFLAERRVFLENVSYETERLQIAQGAQLKLGVRDTVVAQIIRQSGVKVTYNRSLRFEPDGPFSLSVSFAVMLVFNPGTRDEVDWRTIDVAAEFKKNCPSVMQAMMSRAALLVAEITSASGGLPIIPLK